MSKRHPNLIKIGKKIKEMRKMKGFSQEGFAAEAELGRTYYGRVERGEQNISIQNLIQISLKLRVEVEELIPPLRSLKSPKPQIIYLFYLCDLFTTYPILDSYPSNLSPIIDFQSHLLQ